MQVNVGDRVLPVAAFRGTTRPVLIVGTKGHIQRAIRAAEPFKYELRQRGVSLITLQTDELDSNSKLDALKKEFGRCAYFRAAKGLDARPLAGFKCFFVSSAYPGIHFCVQDMSLILPATRSK